MNQTRRHEAEDIQEGLATLGIGVTMAQMLAALEIADARAKKRRLDAILAATT